MINSTQQWKQVVRIMYVLEEDPAFSSTEENKCLFSHMQYIKKQSKKKMSKTSGLEILFIELSL